MRMHDFQTQQNYTEEEGCSANENARFPDTTKLHAEESAATFWRRRLLSQ